MGLCCLACGAFAWPQVLDEYQVKAVFLYNFAKFVEWPDDMPADALYIGIIGEDPFGPVLDKVVNGKTVGGRRLIVKRLKNPQQARECHIVFVGTSEKKRMRPILDTLHGAGVLTVSEMPGFSESGGVINFEIAGNKVHFDINVEAAERARLRVSSKLLSLAKIVRDRNE